MVEVGQLAAEIRSSPEPYKGIKYPTAASQAQGGQEEVEADHVKANALFARHARVHALHQPPAAVR